MPTKEDLVEFCPLSTNEINYIIVIILMKIIKMNFFLTNEAVRFYLHAFIAKEQNQLVIVFVIAENSYEIDLFYAMEIISKICSLL